MRSVEAIRRIVAAGWYEVRQAGSHKHFRHASRLGTVTVPHAKADRKIGTLKSIERQSDVALR